jgi:hypothetical protein
MSVTFEKLSEENWKSLHGLCLGVYLDGCCYEFALAVSRGTGWPMVGLMHNDTIRHVAVVGSDGNIRDARGIVALEKFRDPFGLTSPSQLRSVSEAEILKVRPVNDFGIARASLMAEALWPEWPWKETCRCSKVFAFLTELEDLCKKHEVWIRAPYQNMRIVIDEMHGDEGFVFEPTMTGQHFFDRKIEN